jgi:predicted glutamine amidotransferase
MIAFIGSPPEAGRGDCLDKLYRIFRAGSECDPYAKAAYGPESACHPHGWGMALYDGVGLHHFRSSLPSWQTDIPLPPIKGKCIYAIFHSRLASDPTLASVICSHPFMDATDKEVLLFAHNGGIEMGASSSSRLVDSEWALARTVQMGGIEVALPELKERTKPESALNFLLLAIPRDEKSSPAIHALNFYKTENVNLAAYYKMYIADFAGGKVVMSSTFKDMKLGGMTNIIPAPFGQLLSFSNSRSTVE